MLVIETAKKYQCKKILLKRLTQTTQR